MGLLDPKFKYVPSGSTDIRKTFERERKRLKRVTEHDLPPGIYDVVLEDAKVIGGKIIPKIKVVK